MAHVQNTNSQDNPPDLGKKIAYKANRAGVAQRFAEPAVHKSIEVDLALITYDDQLLCDSELSLLHAAKHHAANTLSLLQTMPGIGKILSLVRLDEIHAIARFPSVQDFVSYYRLVKCAKESAGKCLGRSGQKLGNAHRKWAFSEAAVLFLRNNPAGPKYMARLATKHNTGKAWTILAHTLAQAVYYMLTSKTAFAMDKCLHGSGSRAGEPAASLDTPGAAWYERVLSCGTASLNAKVRVGVFSQSPRL